MCWWGINESFKKWIIYACHAINLIKVLKINKQNKGHSKLEEEKFCSEEWIYGWLKTQINKYIKKYNFASIRTPKIACFNQLKD